MEIIAEIGQNHNGDMKLAKKLILSAKENGADAVKFQVYDAKSLFSKENNPWYDYNLSTELSKSDLFDLADYSSHLNIDFFASVFDVSRIDWLEEIKVKRYKVASRSIHDKPLINKLSLTGKNLLVSLGMWTDKSFPVIQTTAQVDYLYCLSKYPASFEDLHLGSVDFSMYSGFSDHTIGITAAITALARGARIIEKHFTLDKKMYGPDHMCSMTPDELQQLSQYKNDLKKILS